ncbi:hypothetical protein Ade02nite_22430 [Paractinoplanes deccanensis]|uniref:NACHT domain-containing protein n=1 Tax=Paractinoplanes deccanensis TaxID=113561 RepID=A0ABQ3Y0U4_9ACTN|nr:hypothetical protein [Actinoplanes deccanensis]GID73602.1 hypothetical protein Ade02nite_22430 [Actinoplanes deccanensis]
MHLGAPLDEADKISSVVGAVVAVLTAFGVRLGFRWFRRLRLRMRWLPVRRLPEPAVERLLQAQRVAAEQSTYEPWRFGQPLLGETYVEQQTEELPSERAEEPARFDAGEMLARFHDVVVVGGPGTGKSTLANTLVRESAAFWSSAGRFRPAASPLSSTVAVRVPASDLAQAKGDTLAEALAAHFTDSGIPLGADTFRRQPVRRATWLIVLDGFDEVLSSVARSRLLTLIRHELTSPNRTTRLLVTSRSPLETAVKATELRLCVFDDERLELFAGKWFRCRRSQDPRGEAGRFLARFGAGPLANLIRVPLMAAMAAVIHEFDRAVRPPTSRTELYEQFVDVLRRSRGPLPELGRPEAAVWLGENLDGLLGATACETIRSGPGTVFSAAADYCAREAPAPIRAWLRSSEGLAALREHLLATSLIMSDGVTLTFIHHSVAEFLAASGQPADLPRLLADMGDPATRSYALFCVARAGLAPAAISALLRGPGSDPIRAGHLLLDGTAVPPGIQRQVAADLGDCLLSDGATAGEALTLLAGLAALDHDVADWLAVTARSPQTPPWPRTLISDMIANVDVTLGTQLLNDVAKDRRIEERCRRWAAHRLISHGDVMGRHLLNGMEKRAGRGASTNEPGTSLAMLADRQIAMDRRHGLPVRAEAALRLMEDPRNDDPHIRDVLRRICRDGNAPAGLRRKAAATLASHRAPSGVRDIEELLRDRATPEDTMATVVETLATAAGDEAIGILEAMATDPSVPLATRTSILTSSRLSLDYSLPKRVALDPTAEPELRTEAVRFFRNHGGGHGAIHALCTDRSAPQPTRALVIDTMRLGSCPEDLPLLRHVATDPRDDGILRLHAAKVLLDRGDPAAETVLRDLARGRHADWWLARGAADLLQAPAPSAPSAEAAEQIAIGLADEPDTPFAVLDDPAVLRKQVADHKFEIYDRRAAASRLLSMAEASQAEWVIHFAWSQDGTSTRRSEDVDELQDLVVDHLSSRPNSLDRCRALVLDPRSGPRARGRLAMHLLRVGDGSDLTRVRPLALETEIRIEVREIIVEDLLHRLEPDDVDALVDAALQPRNADLTRLVVRRLLAANKHRAVRRLWPALSDSGYDDGTRLAIGETLAWNGSTADQDELRRLISTEGIRPWERLRFAEILSHRGDTVARRVLRQLACDDDLDGDARAKALALIAVPREAADTEAVRQVALDRLAPDTLRRSAMHSLGDLGTTDELRVIRAIGADARNPVELRRLAGETLAELGDRAGLAILDALSAPGPHAAGRSWLIPGIARH